MVTKKNSIPLPNHQIHSGYINQSLQVDEHFPPFSLDNDDDDDFKTDIYEDDDDDDEEEVIFSDTTSTDGEQNNNDDDDNDIFSDDYLDELDDGIVVDVSESLSMKSASPITSTTKSIDSGVSRTTAAMAIPAPNQYQDIDSGTF